MASDIFPSMYKGFENSVKQMLTQEYKFLGGEKIQEIFIKDLLVEFNRHLKDGWKLDAVQIVWWAAHKDEYPGRNKTIENTRMVPVILSIAIQNDLKLRLDGYSAKVFSEKANYLLADVLKYLGFDTSFITSLELALVKLSIHM